MIAETLKTKKECWLEVDRSIEHVYGPGELDYGEDELVVVCVVRDREGLPYVKSFVEHYFSLGARHIVFLAVEPEDGAVEALKDHDDVTVLRTDLPYKASGLPVGNGWTRGVLFKQYLVSRFGDENRWCLCVDVDELFDYPYSDVVELGSFLRYLRSKRYTAVVAQILDMFPEAPLSGRTEVSDEPLKVLHRFYDLSGITRRDLKTSPRWQSNVFNGGEIEGFSGGIRKTVFGHRPFLTKVPLVFRDGRTRHMVNAHMAADARIADLMGVLLHYKFLDGHFHAKVDRAVRKEHRGRNSAAYKAYKAGLDESPVLQMKRDTARELKSVNDLVEKDFLTVSDNYARWTDAEEEKNVLRDASRSGSRGLAETFVRSRKRERAKTLEIRKLRRQLRKRRVSVGQTKRLRKRNRNLEQQLQNVYSSKSWRILNTLNRLRKSVV